MQSFHLIKNVQTHFLFSLGLAGPGEDGGDDLTKNRRHKHSGGKKEKKERKKNSNYFWSRAKYENV